MGTNDYKFSLDNFKKWMREQNREHVMDRPSGDTLVGSYVEPKVGIQKLVSKMEADTQNLEEMAIDFKENGGRIAEVEGKSLLIEVDSGCFSVHRYYVKRG